MTPDRIPLTEDELAGLIRASASHKGGLSCAFTPKGTSLITAESPWAVVLIQKWRGLTFEEGAGI